MNKNKQDLEQAEKEGRLSPSGYQELNSLRKKTLEQELKDIREKAEQTLCNGTYAKCGALNGVAGMMCKQIQIETYQLGKQAGREETLKEIEQRLQTLIPLPNNEFGQKLGVIMLVIAKELKEAVK